ncbi:hypothetical protein AB0F81_12990 [Actinoplanes sp. NPDC024001]|uniref:hypothetical protein n=1 Tax=Actinoplanes sp. NPDC024001 TaxID=3154598 RepID=UPI0033F25EBC
MPGIRDILTRFRPAGAPGRPSPAGVPADRRAAARAELTSVFAALTGTQGDAAAIRQHAHERAAARVEAARSQTRYIVDQAHAASETARARAATEVWQAAQQELAELHSEAERSAAALRDRAEARLPAWREIVTAQLRTDLR